MSVRKPQRPRKRRSPDEARREILNAAEARLREYGLAGLNVVDVAGACGMSHATVIHHFGNTAGMRRALVADMTDRLLRDIIGALRQEPALEPSAILERLFDALSRGGHARLLAWLSIGDEGPSEGLEPPDHVLQLFAELVPVLAARLPLDGDREAVARRIIFLIATAAIGYGVAGASLARMISLDDVQAAAFPVWLGRRIEALLAESGSSGRRGGR